MNCCGQLRARAVLDAEAQSGTVAVPRPAYGTVVFEYTGRTGMAVMGPVTRATYRFDGFGARVSVDGRDGVALATVRALRRV